MVRAFPIGIGGDLMELLAKIFLFLLFGSAVFAVGAVFLMVMLGMVAA